MKRTTTISCLAVLLTVSTCFAADRAGKPVPGRPIPGRPMPGRPMPGGPSVGPMVPGGGQKGEKKWNEAEFVFMGKLDKVAAGPVANSLPPIYTNKLTFTVEKVLRGSLKAGEKIVCSHSARQMKRPVFPEGRFCLVAAEKSRGTMIAKIVEESTPEKLADVTLACTLPLGWKMQDGGPISPWAGLGKKAWDATIDVKTDLVGAKTGRPALMAGSEVKFDVEKVPPKEEIKWTNPDGDGEYRITVSNPTKETLFVPALLSQDGKILWDESLVILCQNKVYPCPGAKGVAGQVEPTELKPGESVSTVVNTFRLKGPEWPRGGYRIEFRFCLGERSQTKSFYYMSRHHDKIRQQAETGD